MQRLLLPGDDTVEPNEQQLTRTQQGLVDTADLFAIDGPKGLLFQHSVLCQTCLPYRDPGDATSWERRNGRVSLNIESLSVVDPETGDRVRLGLPYGPKPRLLMMHINTEALRTGERRIHVAESMTAFVRSIGLDTGGRTITTVKAQMARLASCMIQLGAVTEQSRSVNIDTKIIQKFDLWYPRADNQRVLWSSYIELASDYFEDLQAHAVPLNEMAIAKLSGHAMALDVYTWLAQRLHRVPPKGHLVPWSSLKMQFGWNYDRMRKFREKFSEALDLVAIAYPEARVGPHYQGKGIVLQNSPPPVRSRSILIRPPQY